MRPQAQATLAHHVAPQFREDRGSRLRADPGTVRGLAGTADAGAGSRRVGAISGGPVARLVAGRSRNSMPIGVTGDAHRFTATCRASMSCTVGALLSPGIPATFPDSIWSRPASVRTGMRSYSFTGLGARSGTTSSVANLDATRRAAPGRRRAAPGRRPPHPDINPRRYGPVAAMYRVGIALASHDGGVGVGVVGRQEHAGVPARY